MEREGYRANAGDRCYFCKAELLDVLAPLAAEHGLAARRHRHQRRRRAWPASGPASGRPPSAARSPRCATPASPRRRSGRRRRRWGLPTWDKPAAACLSSRVAYGIEVTPHRLARVERAEAARPRGAGRRRRRRCATCGCATSATGPRSRSTPTAVAAVRGRAGGARRGARGRASPRSRSTRGVPLRLDERAAGRPGAVPLTNCVEPGCRPPVGWTVAADPRHPRAEEV